MLHAFYNLISMFISVVFECKLLLQLGPFQKRIAPATQEKRERHGLSTLPPTTQHTQKNFLLLISSSDPMHSSSFLLLLFPSQQGGPSRSTFLIRTKETTHQSTSRWKQCGCVGGRGWADAKVMAALQLCSVLS